MKNIKIYMLLILFYFQNNQLFSLKKCFLYSTLTFNTISWFFGKYGKYNLMNNKAIIGNENTPLLKDLIDKYQKNLFKKDDFLQIKSKTDNKIYFFTRKHLAYVISGWRQTSEVGSNCIDKFFNFIIKRINLNINLNNNQNNNSNNKQISNKNNNNNNSINSSKKKDDNKKKDENNAGKIVIAIISTITFLKSFSYLTDKFKDNFQKLALNVSPYTISIGMSEENFNNLKENIPLEQSINTQNLYNPNNSSNPFKSISSINLQNINFNEINNNSSNLINNQNLQSNYQYPTLEQLAEYNKLINYKYPEKLDTDEEKAQKQDKLTIKNLIQFEYAK